MTETERKQQIARVSESPLVLIISKEPADVRLLSAIVFGLNCTVHTACTCEESLHHLTHHAAAVVVSDDILPDGNWKRILAMLEFSKRAPRLVVTSRLADDRMWAEVLNLGGYDVLSKPFISEEVARVIALACTPAVHGRGGPGA